MDGIGLVILAGIDHLVERQLRAVVLEVPVMAFAVRAGQHFHRTVANVDLVERNPGRAGGQWTDRPVFAILMPWSF